jgi:hypothetical protein
MESTTAFTSLGLKKRFPLISLVLYFGASSQPVHVPESARWRRKESNVFLLHFSERYKLELKAAASFCHRIQVTYYISE